MKTIIKISWPEPGDSMFTAFEWDIHLYGTYEAIFKSLKIKYPNLTFKYGSKTLPSQEKSLGIAEFINRNKQLYDIFVEGIESSDIFIADITGHNPNVMLELGIAMRLNKNILILREKNNEEKFPFDIQSVQINEYSSVSELKEIITEFIEMYSKIRNQTFDNYLQERYTKVDKIVIEVEGRGAKFISHEKFPKGVKNLLIRFKYNFPDHVNTDDWLGVHVRTQGPERNNSELIYSRVNGRLESLSWPSYNTPVIAEESGKKSGDDDIFEISVIENKLNAQTKSKKLIDENVFADGFGDILIGIQSHTPSKGMDGHKLQVEFIDIEIINLDTTAAI